ncbi:uncharacterized protein LOC117334271 [Pecten maximus]|uniref:uncharacterized protein LOC117334271 n=1 Tax=Pecten maximus TaxID=6579 RepID=UPI001458E213|nr:uncharacterized protein LOC117334271 [Pecten maximus]
MLKHSTLNDVTDLCKCLSSISVKNADETKEARTSFKLECLTTCYKWFRSKEPSNLENTSESSATLLYLVVDLIQTDADPFVLYAARKALVVLLDHQSCKTEITECLHGILDCLGSKDIGTSNKTTVLEIISDLLQREFAVSVLDVIKQRFLWLVENVLTFPFQEDESILLTAFIILWRKSAKKCHDLQLDLCWIMKYDILLQTLNEINVTEKHVYSRQVIHLFKTFYCYGQSLCLKTSVEPIYLQLGTAILQWALDRGISYLHDNSASGFGGKLITGACKSQINTEFGNVSSLRQLAALLLSVAATIVRFIQNSEVNPALLNLSTCLLQLNDHATVTVHSNDHRSQPFDWMTSVFGDQDDTLMEALLEVLDIYTITRKRLDTLGPYLEKLVIMINPHRQFYMLLQMTGFDHSVLVDLLTSPETCALLYLTRYLKCVVNEWDIFLETLDSLCDRETDFLEQIHRKSDSGHHFTENQGENLTENVQTDVQKSSGVSYKQTKQNCDERKTKGLEEKLNARSIQDNPAPKESITKCESETECVSGEEHRQGFIADKMLSACSESGSKPEYTKSGTEVSVAGTKSEGLTLLGQYSSDEDEEDVSQYQSDHGFSDHVSQYQSDHVSQYQSEADNSQIVSKMETMDIESSLSGEDFQCRKPVSEITIQSEYIEAIEICDNKLQVNRCLDETMATLIRLRLKMESLCEGGLLMYHPGPLVRLLTQCEALYEQ